MISDLQNSAFEPTSFAGVNTGVWNNFKILSGSNNVYYFYSAFYI